MGGLLDAMSFLGGVGDRAREYDVEENKRAQKIAELKAKRTDELLKTKWTSAKKKRDAHSEINTKVDSAGGVASLSGQMLLKGIDNSDEYWKRRVAEGDSYTHATLFELGETPTITYADEDAIYKKTLKNQGTTSGRIFESLGGPKRDEVTNVPTDIESGNASTYRRGKSIANTAQQTTKMDSWKNVDADEKEWQFKWRTYQTDYTDAIEKYKDSPKSEEAKQVFSQLTQDRRTLLYGKGEGKTDWQRKYNLHLLDRPKSDDFVTDKAFDLHMKKWKHGYNILKLGANYDDKTKSGKDQIISLWNDEGIQVKVMRTDNPDDMFDGMPGWRQFGGAEKDTATSTPKIGDKQEVYVSGNSGAKQKLYYTGSDTDSFNGKFIGWTTIGGTSGIPEASFTKQRWDLIQAPIYAAIKGGTKVDPKDWEAFRLYTLSNKDAIGIEYQSVLNSLESLAEDGLSYPSITIEVDEKKVPATMANMILKAKESNISLKSFRNQLYKHYLSKQIPK